MKHDLHSLVEQLIWNGLRLNILDSRDTVYIRNQYYALLELQNLARDIPNKETSSALNNICISILANLDDRILKTLGDTQEQQVNRLINTMLPFPSIIENNFQQIKQRTGIKDALDWYYQFCCNNDYIQSEAIAKNKNWKSQNKYGELEITINLSKPEKDPKEIAKLKQSKATNQYPQCLLCIENEGYSGDNKKPSRHNHRLLQMTLNNQPWYFQFSPYAYYPEHSIVINHEHKPMIIDTNTIKCFCDFVDQVPHYLIGSNSDIPIVGGSILNHDHFQAGNYIFPIEKAMIKFSQTINNVQVEYLHWPITTLRLTGNKPDLIYLTEALIKHWYHFSMPELDIVAFSPKGVRHNAVTPIMRKIDSNNYQLYIMLRNNRTSNKYPDGIFHPHQELHHIKKENIGLIEAMGIAILPGRLDYELTEMNKFLTMNDHNLANLELLYDEQMLKHKIWLNELYQKYNSFDKVDNFELLRIEIGVKFCQVLENSGVFKQNAKGDNGIKWFLESLE